MPDRLYDDIARAIERPLRGDLFERCAVDLLREYYPTLRPVEGGNDAGMDGVGELPNGERFFLVATVGEDSRTNLERNIQSHLEAGGDRRVVVFATTRKVTGQRRVELANYVEKRFGVWLAEVHDRADFVQLIYRSPRWRKDLVNVPALAKALTRLPASRRPMPEIPIIGREDALEHLRTLTGDLVLVGKPGIGKTFLLQKLMEEDWGLFDDGGVVTDLEDAIRELRPRRVVLDDAHLNEDRIAVLRRLRLEMDAEFYIVAVSWPGQQAEVAAALVGSQTFVVLELDRDQILEIIKEVGIAGPRELQALLVNQSLGRAGLAVTLAHGCISGHVREVAAGDALLTDVVGWFTRSIGHESRHVLGVLALGGRNGATMEQVARVLGLSVARVSELVRGLASGGTVDEASRTEHATRLRVQPESLRYALVKDVFYGGPGSLDVARAIAQLDRPSIALLPLVRAAYWGAPIDRGFLLTLVESSNEDDVVAYALLGADETREALQIAPQHQRAIARAAYESNISADLMLRRLMELAVGDLRDEHNSPDHPLRVIGDHLAGSDGTIEARKLAVSVVEQWLRDGGDSDVAFRVLKHAVEPRVRLAYSDPGLGNTVTISEGSLPISAIRELSKIWDSVLEVVARERTSAVAPLLDALHPWVYPSTLGFDRGPDDATAAAIRDEATRVISRLADIFRDRSGILHRLRDYVSRAQLDVIVNVPTEFDILFPAHWNGAEDDGGYGGWEQSVDEAVRRLATDLQQLPVGEAARLITEADTEAASAGITYPRLTPALARILAAGTEEPETYLYGLEQLIAAGDILLPFLERVVYLKPVGWELAVERLLVDDRTAWAATQVALIHPVGSRLKDLAIDRMTPAYGNLIEFIIAARRADPDTLERLLNAGNQVVARDAAVALGHASSGAPLEDLSQSAQARWRAVIVQSPADDYWYSVILGRDPDLFADWLRAWLGRMRDGSSYELLPHTLEEVIRQLPAEVRAELIREVPSDVPSFYVQDLVTLLVSNDLKVAEILFERADLKSLQSAALHDGPSEVWMERALAAYERGSEPTQIVAMTMFAERGWSGEESRHWQSKVDAFKSLRESNQAVDTPRERIISAGVEYFEKRRDAAAEGERRERVFGYDRK